MDAKELKTYRLALKVINGKLKLKDFSQIIGKSYRQSQRIIKRVQDEDYMGVMHKNRFQVPHNKAPERVEVQIVDWLEFKYQNFNVTHECFFTFTCQWRDKLRYAGFCRRVI